MESAMFSDMVHLKKLELLYFLPEMTLFEKCCVSFYLDSVSAMCSMVMISLSTFLARSIRSQKKTTLTADVCSFLLVFVESPAQKTVKKTMSFSEGELVF